MIGHPPIPTIGLGFKRASSASHVLGPQVRMTAFMRGARPVDAARRLARGRRSFRELEADQPCGQPAVPHGRITDGGIQVPTATAGADSVPVGGGRYGCPAPGRCHLRPQNKQARR